MAVQKHRDEQQLRKAEETRRAQNETQRRQQGASAFKDWVEHKARVESERQQELHLLQTLMDEHHQVTHCHCSTTV